MSRGARTDVEEGGEEVDVLVRRQLVQDVRRHLDGAWRVRVRAGKVESKDTLATPQTTEDSKSRVWRW